MDTLTLRYHLLQLQGNVRNLTLLKQVVRLIYVDLKKGETYLQPGKSLKD